MKLRTMTRQFSRYAEAEGNPWFSPGAYSPNKILRLSVPNSRSIVDARVIKAFHPFTNSVTLLVEIRPGSSNRLPRELILKLADRRFGHRPGGNLWTEDQEHKFQLELYKYYEIHGSHVDFDTSSSPVVDNELLWWNELNRFHKQEATAYSHLTEAQNFGLVPKFYGQTRIQMSQSSGPCHPALESVRGIMLEYVPGRAMDSVRVGVDISVKQAEVISQRVIALGRRLRRYGVTHGDVHLGNIILRAPGDFPVMIDWAFGSTDTDRPIEERWNCFSARMDFDRDIRYVLTEHTDGFEHFWHRASTPLSNEVRERFAQEQGGDANAWRDMNKTIQKLPAHELERYYWEDKRIREDQGLRWKVKDGIRTKDTEDPVPSS